MREIESLLARVLGLNVVSIGRTVVHRAIHERMARCGTSDVAQYHAQLLRDGDELQTLIEELVVSETWFFRNPEAIARLVELFTAEWSVVRQGNVRRVLSVPCATGEEPYSIAIALAEAGLQSSEVQIHAIDISRRALARAEHGVYGQNSFRGEASRVCDRYTYRVPGGVALLPDLRHWVRFAQGNLVAPSFHPLASYYDAIFCRNVLIYLDRAAQEHVLEVLYQLLVPNGYLFVGPAEGPLAAECGFRVMEDAMAFVCQKVSRGIAIPHEDVRPVVKPVLASPLPPLRQPVPVPRQKESRRSVREQQERSPQSTKDTIGTERVESVLALSSTGKASLDRARQLADAGRLTEAADLCTAYIRDYGVTAEAFYLLGLVQDARGHASQAVAYYRKALFLDPNHANASAQLAVHAQRAGDPVSAERLRARAQRIERRRTL
jgi:chemotaxis protein methyltransferase WspC